MSPPSISSKIFQFRPLKLPFSPAISLNRFLNLFFFLSTLVYVFCLFVCFFFVCHFYRGGRENVEGGEKSAMEGLSLSEELEDLQNANQSITVQKNLIAIAYNII